MGRELARRVGSLSSGSGACRAGPRLQAFLLGGSLSGWSPALEPAALAYASAACGLAFGRRVEEPVATHLEKEGLQVGAAAGWCCRPCRGRQRLRASQWRAGRMVCEASGVQLPLRCAAVRRHTRAHEARRALPFVGPGPGPPPPPQFIQFAFRWVNCLLLREVPFPLAIRLWDTYLSEG